MADFTDGQYQPFIPSGQDGTGNGATADRLVLCSGKVYYDVMKAREGLPDPASVAVARVEQLYPFPEEQVRAEIARFAGKPVVWLQEEPANMGAWTFVQPRLDALLPDGARVQYAGRPAAASPATGSASRHAAEQEGLLTDALGVADTATAEAAATQTKMNSAPV